jgi:hypothetical protein
MGCRRTAKRLANAGQEMGTARYGTNMGGNFCVLPLLGGSSSSDFKLRQESQRHEPEDQVYSDYV